MMCGSAESEHPRLTNDEIFRMCSNLCDHNPPTLQTDRRHAIAIPRFALKCIARYKLKRIVYLSPESD